MFVRTETQAGALSARLREGTREDHVRVDAAFGAFDLASRSDYGAFLTAQARVLPALEAALRPEEMVPQWQGRTDALMRDLWDMDLLVPRADAPAIPAGEAGRWGALYVLEGSRLGGAVLARRVSDGLPRAFLSSVHASGGWRDLLGRLDAAELGPGGPDKAIRAAKAVFSAFAGAARALV